MKKMFIYIHPIGFYTRPVQSKKSFITYSRFNFNFINTPVIEMLCNTFPLLRVENKHGMLIFIPEAFPMDCQHEIYTSNEITVRITESLKIWLFNNLVGV